MSQQINLFNPIFLKQEKHFSAMTMAQALGLILVLGIFLTGYSFYRLSSVESEARFTAAQLQLAQDQLAKVTTAYGPKQEDPQLKANVQHAESEVQSLQQVSDILKNGDFGNTSGYANYLSAFARQIIDGVWLTGFSIQGAGNDISIQGSALRPELVPAYLNRLKSEPVMQGASFATLEMTLPKQEPVVQAEKTDKPVHAGVAYINFDLHSSVDAKDLPSDLTVLKSLPGLSTVKNVLDVAGVGSK
jgi:hypothetical protein